jgi:hypothetical protein
MTFTPNVPFETPQSSVTVDGGLPPGVHRFRLEVVNHRRQRSKPVEVSVTILERVRPIPIPDPVRPGPIR